MNRFQYASPVTKESAVNLLGSNAVALAGGTDLLSLMKADVVAPDLVVNIKEISDLKGIEYKEGSGLRIGALVTIDELLQNAKVQEEYASLSVAADGIRSAQIRSIGTVAGDLCQRPRCWYYRHGYGLLAMQNGSSMVIDGDNRYHAILGNAGPAYFVNPSSFAPALIALGASLKIVGPNGEREIPVADFFKTPQSEGEKEYNLADSEIVTEILVPPAAGKANATYEVRDREALDWPHAAAAVALSMQGDQVGSAKVVLGHVAPIPWNSDEAAAVLNGKAVNANVADDAGKAAVQQAKALSRNKYKIQLARVAVKRAILRAAGMEV